MSPTCRRCLTRQVRFSSTKPVLFREEDGKLPVADGHATEPFDIQLARNVQTGVVLVPVVSRRLSLVADIVAPVAGNAPSALRNITDDELCPILLRGHWAVSAEFILIHEHPRQPVADVACQPVKEKSVLA